MFKFALDTFKRNVTYMVFNNYTALIETDRIMSSFHDAIIIKHRLSLEMYTKYKS